MCEGLKIPHDENPVAPRGVSAMGAAHADWQWPEVISRCLAEVWN